MYGWSGAQWLVWGKFINSISLTVQWLDCSLQFLGKFLWRRLTSKCFKYCQVEGLVNWEREGYSVWASRDRLERAGKENEGQTYANEERVFRRVRKDDGPCRAVTRNVKLKLRSWFLVNRMMWRSCKVYEDLCGGKAKCFFRLPHFIGNCMALI